MAYRPWLLLLLVSFAAARTGADLAPPLELTPHLESDPSPDASSGTYTDVPDINRVCDADAGCSVQAGSGQNVNTLHKFGDSEIHEEPLKTGDAAPDGSVDDHVSVVETPLHLAAADRDELTTDDWSFVQYTRQVSAVHQPGSCSTHAVARTTGHAVARTTGHAVYMPVTI